MLSHYIRRWEPTKIFKFPDQRSLHDVLQSTSVRKWSCGEEDIGCQNAWKMQDVKRDVGWYLHHCIPSEAYFCRPFDQRKWDSSYDKIVEWGNFLNFSQNPELRATLLGTGDKTIIKSSPSDRVWGIGFDSEHAEGRESRWGANKLGEALMKVQETLQRWTSVWNPECTI